MSVRRMIEQWGQTASTTRATSGIDAFGGQTLTYSTSISSLTAFVQPARGTEGPLNGRKIARQPATAYILPGQDVLATDRLIVGSTTYTIASVHTPDMRTSTDALGYTVLVVEELTTA